MVYLSQLPPCSRVFFLLRPRKTVSVWDRTMSVQMSQNHKDHLDAAKKRTTGMQQNYRTSPEPVNTTVIQFNLAMWNSVISDSPPPKRFKLKSFSLEHNFQSIIIILNTSKGFFFWFLCPSGLEIAGLSCKYILHSPYHSAKILE